MGYLKGKSAIHIARTWLGRRQNFVGHHFWARGYWVSTVGRNEAVIRNLTMSHFTLGGRTFCALFAQTAPHRNGPFHQVLYHQRARSFPRQLRQR